MKYKMNLKPNGFTGTGAEGMTRQQKREIMKKANKAVRYADTDLYLTVKEAVNKMVNMSDHLTSEEGSVYTSVGSFIYQSNKTTVELPDGSHIRFGTRAKSLDISRVWVSPENHGKRVGTYLVGMVLIGVLKWIEDNPEKEFPKVTLECTGSVGLGENRQDTPIKDQMRFFGKFGFVLDRVDKENIHHMVLDPMNYINWVKKSLLKKEVA